MESFKYTYLDIRQDVRHHFIACGLVHDNQSGWYIQKSKGKKIIARYIKATKTLYSNKFFNKLALERYNIKYDKEQGFLIGHPEYNFFTFDALKKQIKSGWEYKEDAECFLQENEQFSSLKTYTRRYIKQLLFKGVLNA